MTCPFSLYPSRIVGFGVQTRARADVTISNIRRLNISPKEEVKRTNQSVQVFVEELVRRLYTNVFD